MGWKSCIYVCFVLCFPSSFSVFCLFLSVVLCFRLVFLSFCIYNRKNTYKHRKQHKHSKENIKNRKNRNLPARPLEIFICGRVEGWISCIYVVAVCLRVFHISPSLFKFCWKSWKNDAQRFFAMKFCILQGGQKAGGGIGHHPYIYIYIYIYPPME